MRITTRLIVGLVSLAAEAGFVSADEVVISASKDNTLYEDSFGKTSNGKGQFFLAGTNANGGRRRAVIAFDVAGRVPAGATITSVRLTLYMSRTTGPDESVVLHALTADWGEGESDADFEEGIPDDAKPGDATWIHTFYADQKWKSEGGDFVDTVSATTKVGGTGYYAWGSTAQMVSDVQGWVDDPARAFGWILIAPEDRTRTAKRFNSLQNPDEATRPELVVTFDPPPPCRGQRVGDANCDGAVDFGDIDCFVAALIGAGDWLACVGEGSCSYECVNDVNQDGSVDFGDIDGLVECLISGC